MIVPEPRACPSFQRSPTRRYFPRQRASGPGNCFIGRRNSPCDAAASHHGDGRDRGRCHTRQSAPSNARGRSIPALAAERRSWIDHRNRCVGVPVRIPRNERIATTRFGRGRAHYIFEVRPGEREGSAQDVFIDWSNVKGTNRASSLSFDHPSASTFCAISQRRPGYTLTGSAFEDVGAEDGAIRASTIPGNASLNRDGLRRSSDVARDMMTGFIFLRSSQWSRPAPCRSVRDLSTGQLGADSDRGAFLQLGSIHTQRHERIDARGLSLFLFKPQLAANHVGNALSVSVSSSSCFPPQPWILPRR